jgi:hypothetical protein
MRLLLQPQKKLIFFCTWHQTEPWIVMSVPYFFVLLPLHGKNNVYWVVKLLIQPWSFRVQEVMVTQLWIGLPIWHIHICYLGSQHPFVHFGECLTILRVIIECRFDDDKNIHLSASQHLTWHSWGWLLRNVKCFGICDQYWSLQVSLTDVLCLFVLAKQYLGHTVNPIFFPESWGDHRGCPPIVSSVQFSASVLSFTNVVILGFQSQASIQLGIVIGFQRYINVWISIFRPWFYHLTPS